MDYTTIVKTAVAVQAVSVVGLAGTFVYCAIKQRQLDAIGTNLEKTLAQHDRAMNIARTMNLAP